MNYVFSLKAASGKHISLLNILVMKILLFAFVCCTVNATAQNSLVSEFVEGGKTIVELIRVIKTPKILTAVGVNTGTDSCGVKKMADICFKNKTAKTVQVSLYLRNGNAYALIPLVLNIAPSSQENLFAIQSGIYKYKIETNQDTVNVILHEGELKLEPCEKSVREVK